MPADEIRHAVVRQARHVGRDGRRPEGLDRRRPEAYHLRVFAELVHDPESRVEIDDRGNRPHALVDVLAVRRDLEHPVVELAREDVVEDVELHRRL